MTGAPARTSGRSLPSDALGAEQPRPASLTSPHPGPRGPSRPGDLEAPVPPLPRPTWAPRGVRSAHARMSKPVEGFYETLLEPNRGHIWRQDVNRPRKMLSGMLVCSFYMHVGLGGNLRKVLHAGAGSRARRWIAEGWSWPISETG